MWHPRARSEPADLSGIYGRAAAQDLSTRNPVILIPGVMGSNLVDPESSASLWGDFRERFIKPKRQRGRRLFALPMARGEPLHRLLNPAEADGTLRRAKASFAGVHFEWPVYGTLMTVLGIAAYSLAGTGRGKAPVYSEEAQAASFEFAYDWRRSVDENAARLYDFVQLASYFVRARRSQAGPVKFDVIAHSMGGLVLRYFLQYGGQLLPHDGSLPRLSWAGADHVEHAIIIGTPNGGSLRALHRLVFGLAGNPVHPGYDAAVLGTMPSLYQMLPRWRHAPLRVEGQRSAPDLLDPKLWLDQEWGLADPRQDPLLAQQLPGVDTPAERFETALEHQRKCLRNARALQAALDRAVTKSPDLRLHLVAGDAFATPRSALVEAKPGRPRLCGKGPGDGTVLRSSALLDERPGHVWEPRLRSPIPWDSVLFVRSRHMGLARDPVVMDNLLFEILERPR